MTKLVVLKWRDSVLLLFFARLVSIILEDFERVKIEAWLWLREEEIDLLSEIEWESYKINIFDKKFEYIRNDWLIVTYD